MTDQPDEYVRRYTYLRWAYDAFTTVDANPDAVRATYAKLHEAGQRDPVAGHLSTALFIWVCRWWNPYSTATQTADRAAVIDEIRAEALLARELAEL